jgi:hypothetical protein
MGFASSGVTCKIEAECFYQTFVLDDREVLRNRQLRQHANRYIQCYDYSAIHKQTSKKHDYFNYI